MTTIGFIGIGLFVLILVWILALVLFVVAVRLQSNLGWVGLCLAGSLTLILALIPTDTPPTNDEFVVYDNEFKDYAAIYKRLLLSALLLSLIVALFVFVTTHCLESIRPKSVDPFAAPKRIYR